MSAPLIGLTTYREHAAWGVWQPARRRAARRSTPRAVEATGGVPVLLPPVAQAGAADAVVARLDGLVISGGADVDPGAVRRASRTRARPAGAPTATPGSSRCSTPPPPPGSRCWASAAACS